jgi:hypothetical protein
MRSFGEGAVRLNQAFRAAGTVLMPSRLGLLKSAIVIPYLGFLPRVFAICENVALCERLFFFNILAKQSQFTTFYIYKNR